jgi:hypothetical protein
LTSHGQREGGPLRCAQGVFGASVVGIEGRDFAAQDMLALALVLGVPVQAFYREAVETAGQEIQMPSGMIVPESAMRRVYGLGLPEAHRIAHDLEKAAADVRLLGEGGQ